MTEREQFEAAWDREYPLHGGARFTRGFDGERYANTRVQDGWLMWQASRAQADSQAPVGDEQLIDKADAELYRCLEKEAHRKGFTSLIDAIIQASKQSTVAPSVAHRGGDALNQAAKDVLMERERQVVAEGWTPEHDDKHDKGELSDAAACYAASRHWKACPPFLWPWDSSWWKQSSDPRRDLVKAGALVLAEIERLDRIAQSPQAKDKHD